jgi:DNA-directed RNA polymerase specialized sigma24 family protein
MERESSAAHAKVHVGDTISDISDALYQFEVGASRGMALSTLTSVQARVIALAVINGQPHREIAECT